MTREIIWRSAEAAVVEEADATYAVEYARASKRPREEWAIWDVFASPEEAMKFAEYVLEKGLHDTSFEDPEAEGAHIPIRATRIVKLDV